ncbi:MAG: SDR family NAD(P)-dependent oxidoreductase [Acetobacteraceae bacterium]|nr:SDR family NAD(P)-dependent oxidoreductase [Acetobacteraceae bacterium]MSP29074.1 SDR family NAD(P)-dependent oxidoreductase [Acetobacteraceae bacterium]
MARRLLIFGLGYSAVAVARAALTAGWQVAATYRGSPPAGTNPAGINPAGINPAWADITPIRFSAATQAIAAATHLLTTIAPNATGDPVLADYADAIRAAPALSWISYLSTTGVYGDRGGDWVNEATSPTPNSDRSRHRLAAETAWMLVGEGRAVDIFRSAGIYGPGRSAFDDLRAGRARRVIQPGHAFGRIHRDDIAGAVLAAMAQNPAPGRRILHLSDDEPAEPASVVSEAAALLSIAPPRETPLADAWQTMSPMARSFWAENRKVASQQTQDTLNYRWRYPSYRAGLRAILAEELCQGLRQQ